MRNEIDIKRNDQACCIDMQKTFDLLDHVIQLGKQFTYCFRGSIQEISINYLPNRCQFVSHLSRKAFNYR